MQSMVCCGTVQRLQSQTDMQQRWSAKGKTRTGHLPAVRRGSISCTEDWTRSSAALKSPRSHGRCSQMQLYAVLAIRGRLIAATAAALLETGLAADCTELRRRADGLLIMSRPTFGRESACRHFLSRPQAADGDGPPRHLPSGSLPFGFIHRRCDSGCSAVRDSALRAAAGVSGQR